MRWSVAALGKAILFPLGRALIVGLIPYLVTRWRLHQHLAMLAVISGQALPLGRYRLLVYRDAPWAASPVRPLVPKNQLSCAAFGTEYAAYQRAGPPGGRVSPTAWPSVAANRCRRSPPIAHAPRIVWRLPRPASLVPLIERLFLTPVRRE
jgi:hypothetical protein